MKILKKKMIWSGVITLAGIALFIVNMMQNSDSTITIGFATGITVASIANLIQFYRISKNSQLLKKYEISQKEERFIAISEKSGRLTFLLTVAIEFSAIFILILLSQNKIATIVSFVAGMQILAYLIMHYYFSKKY